MLFLKVKKIEIGVSSTVFVIYAYVSSQYCYWSVVDIDAHIMCAKCNLDAPGQQMQHMGVATFGVMSYIPVVVL